MSIVKKEDTITEENVSTIANEQLMKVLPIGTILPFVGNQSLIPANWFMCDGANGTVDLWERFLCGITPGDVHSQHGVATFAGQVFDGSEVGTKWGYTSSFGFSTSSAGNHQHNMAH